MHAWSEVEHDLIYKPVTGGNVSRDERDILNQLNGMILSGEIALEMLQRAVNIRLSRGESKFSNQYELASFIFNYLRHDKGIENEPVMGRADALLQILRQNAKDKASELHAILEGIGFDFDRPISDQIIDFFIGNNQTSLQTYIGVRDRDPLFRHIKMDTHTPESSRDELLSKFLTLWRRFEQLVAFLVGRPGRPVPLRIAIDALASGGVIDRDLAHRITNMRNIRNTLVHASEPASTNFVEESVSDLGIIIAALEKIANDQREKLGGDSENSAQN